MILIEVSMSLGGLGDNLQETQIQMSDGKTMVSYRCSNHSSFNWWFPEMRVPLNHPFLIDFP